MRLNVPVEVFVVLMMHRDDQEAGKAPVYEFVGVAESIQQACIKAWQYVGAHVPVASFKWNTAGTEGISPRKDHTQSLVIRKIEL